MNISFSRLKSLWSGRAVQIPLLTGFSALTAAWVIVNLDRLLQRAFPVLGAPARSDPQSARLLLAVLAAGMMLVALVGLIAAGQTLSHAIQRYGKRAAGANYYTHRLAWLVSAPLAVAVFGLYSLGTIRGTDSRVFVPHLATAVTLLGGMLTLAAMFWAAREWQNTLEAPQIVARLAFQILSQLASDTPGMLNRNAAHVVPNVPIQTSLPVRAGQAGYILSIDLQALGNLTERHDLYLRIRYRPGDFVLPDETLCIASPAARLDSRLAARVRQAFWVGPNQDEADSLINMLESLSQIAAQALAPNCVNTLLARQCIDWLGAILTHLAEDGFTVDSQMDLQGKLRVTFDRREDFAGVVAAAFDDLRQAIGHHAQLYTYLLMTLTRVMQHAVAPDVQEALLQQAILVRRAAHAALQERHEREVIESHFALVMQAQRENH